MRTVLLHVMMQVTLFTEYEHARIFLETDKSQKMTKEFIESLEKEMAEERSIYKVCILGFNVLGD